MAGGSHVVFWEFISRPAAKFSLFLFSYHDLSLHQTHRSQSKAGFRTTGINDNSRVCPGFLESSALLVYP
jgi:hypothetical protein